MNGQAESTERSVHGLGRDACADGDGPIADDGSREAVASVGRRPSDAVETEELTPEEQGALARVFADVRKLSRDGRLAEPTRWEAEGLVPEHSTADDFEMLVYEYWEGHHARRDGQDAPAKAGGAVSGARAADNAANAVRSSVIRSVGVPPFLRRAGDAPVEGADGGAASGLDAADVRGAAYAGERDDADGQGIFGACEESAVGAAGSVPEEFAGLKLPEGYRLAEIEGEWVLVPVEDAGGSVPEIDCENIEALVGRRSYYLYDRSIMTDAFAHWAFLAAEDDDVVTFVDCAREESRVYPRPMPTDMLENDPFRFSAERIERAWEAVRDSGEYPDVERVEASNGDVYYFSTRYLSRVRAAALAEWASVERARNV